MDANIGRVNLIMVCMNNWVLEIDNPKIIALIYAIPLIYTSVKKKNWFRLVTWIVGVQLARPQSSSLLRMGSGLYHIWDKLQCVPLEANYNSICSSKTRTAVRL